MTGKTYDVVVTNQILDGKSPQEVIKNLGTTLKLSEDKAQKILAKDRTTIKKGADEAVAEKFRTAVEKCGLLCELKPLEQELDLSLESVLESAPAAPATEEEPDKSPYAAPESPLQDDTVFCRSCGASIPADATKCPACGATQIPEAGRSKIAAGFFAFFLGSLGIHRFYLGQWWGIFYIPLSLLYISNIISFFEAIVFWCTSKERWNEKYGHLPPASGGLIAVLIIVPIFMSIFVIGILAAIALPAYQDYTVRAKINEGLVYTQYSFLTEVDDFYDRVGFVPNSNLDAGLPNPEDYGTEVIHSIYIIEGGHVVLTYNDLPGTSEDGELATVIFSRSFESGAIPDWDCTQGTLQNRFRPASCRSEY